MPNIFAKEGEKEMRKKLTDEQIKEIQKKRKEGKTQMELAKEFNVCLKTIQYWTNEEMRKKFIKDTVEYYRGLPKERKMKYNTQQKEYRKNYFKGRYLKDENYRKQLVAANKKYRRKKREEKLNDILPYPKG